MSVNSEIHLHHLVMVANCICKKDDQYLFIRRSPLKIVAPNFLHTPGGKVDPTEDPYLAAMRELKEETGLQVTNVKLKAIVTDVHSLSSDQYANDFFAFYFIGDYAAGDLIDTDEGELVWLTKDQIDKTKMYPSTSKIIDQILNPESGQIFARFLYDDHEKIIEETINECK